MTPPQSTAAASDDTLQLIVLTVEERQYCCRVLGSDRLIELKSNSLWQAVPGEILTVKPKKKWKSKKLDYISGEIQATRIQVDQLGLDPLKIQDCGMWDPSEHYWGEPEGPLEQWCEQLIAEGPRELIEMQQVSPRSDPEDPYDDAILNASDHRRAGHVDEANQLLMNLCKLDLRCLDAHSHLGFYAMDHNLQLAIRHYQVGMELGKMAIEKHKDAVVPWIMIENRPFLRCMQGFGLCLWRLKRFEEAAAVFEQLLRYNPTDNQGARFIIDDIRAKRNWEDCEDD